MVFSSRIITCLLIPATQPRPSLGLRDLFVYLEPPPCVAVEGERRIPAFGLGTLLQLWPAVAQSCPVSFLCSFAFVDLGSVQKVALVIQALNGKPFHNKKLYVNSNRSSPKRTPGVAARPKELQVRAPGFTRWWPRAHSSAG